MQNCMNPLASILCFSFWCWRLPSPSPRGCRWSSWCCWWGRPRPSSRPPPPPTLTIAGSPGSTRCVGTRGWRRSAAIIMTGRTSSPDHHNNDPDNDSDNDDDVSDHERWGCRPQGREWRGHQGDPGLSQQVRVLTSRTYCIDWQFIKEQKQSVLLQRLSSPSPTLVLVHKTWNEDSWMTTRVVL